MLEHTVVSDSVEVVFVDLEEVVSVGTVVGGSEVEEVVVTEACKVSVSVTVSTSGGELVVDDTVSLATVVFWIPKPLSDGSTTSDILRRTQENRGCGGKQERKKNHRSHGLVML